MPAKPLTPEWIERIRGWAEVPATAYNLISTEIPALLAEIDRLTAQVEHIDKLIRLSLESLLICAESRDALKLSDRAKAEEIRELRAVLDAGKKE